MRKPDHLLSWVLKDGDEDPKPGPMARRNCHGMTISMHPLPVTALLNDLNDRNKKMQLDVEVSTPVSA